MTGNEVTDDVKTRIAWLYYIEGMTQDEVSNLVGMNRSRVLRILATARQDGTVQIRVINRLSHCVGLERRPEPRWSLTRAIVVPEPQDPAALRAIIGAEVGAHMSQHVTSNMTTGLGWGKTLTSGVSAIVPRVADGVRVLSLLGGLTRVSEVNPSEFAWRVADRLSAECSMLACPVYAPDARARDALTNRSGIAKVFNRARSLGMAVLSVGELSSHSALSEFGLLSRDEITALERAGAIGDVLCHFSDAEGNLVDHPVNQRVWAINPLDLRGDGQHRAGLGWLVETACHSGGVETAAAHGFDRQ